MENGTFRSIDSESAPLASDNVTALYFDGEGHLWAGASQTLFDPVADDATALQEFDGFEWNAHPTSNAPLPSNDITQLTFSEHDELWAIAQGDLSAFGGLNLSQGLVHFDGSEWEGFSSENAPFGDVEFHDIALVQDTLFLAHEEGVMRYDGVRWTSYVGSDFSEEFGSFSDAEVTRLAVDNNNNVWGVIPQDGLVKFDGSSWSYIENSNTDIGLGSISDLAVSSNGTVWMATEFDGLVSYDGSDWTSHTEDNSDLIEDNMGDVVTGPGGAVWAVNSPTFGDVALYKINGDTWTVYNLPEDTEGMNQLAFAGNGQLWMVGEYEHGGSSYALMSFSDGNFSIYPDTKQQVPLSEMLSVAIDANQQIWVGTQESGIFSFQGNYLFTGIDENRPADGLPRQISLQQNYPNPFNPATNISYSLPQRMNIELAVYNVLGRKVATLYDGVQGAGQHNVVFNARHLASGMYIYRLKAGNKVITKKLTLIK